MIKKTAMVGLGLLLVGIAGSIFTFKSVTGAKEVTEEKVEIHDELEEIEISAKEARVEVLPTDDSKARVELTGGDCNYRLSTDAAGSTLKVDVCHRRKTVYNLGGS